MATAGGFSEDFLLMSSDERRERIRAAGLTKRSDLSEEDLDAFDKATQSMTERWAGRLPMPEVIDRRSHKQTG